ncbi:MAG TPA: TonB-dependent receptor plug domain-containing protein, partial [Flavobacteriaceae bacterium]|nr:TonB-dependent receptor plug domain-containing protein [Flavobacteriaceae bacterium]
MKQKKLFFLFVLFLITVSTALAQEKEITGTVTDNTGVPLPGVNVLIKGTSNGTQTYFDGNYAIRTSMGQTLVFSFVGMATVEETVGSSDTIDVQMVEDLVNLNEVVVTSLGITREKKSLGYAVTELKSEDINTVKDFNVANSLVGKVAGLTINTSGGLGASSRIVIRGNNSITGKNQALVVVDGIPINSSGESSGGSVYSSSVTGGGITDINPEDIESISVLKGPNAAALYGADAAR